MARLQQQIDVLELQEQELLSVQAKMRQIGSQLQSVRDTHCAREGQIEKLRSRDSTLQQTIMDAQIIVQESQDEMQGNMKK